MLHELQAVRFDRKMSVGRTGPCLLSAIRPDGSEVEVVAKFSSGCDRGIGSLVCEAVAAMLAADLDLPVPEPFLVRIDADFVNHFPTALRETAVKLRSSSPLAFGSARLPSGYAVVAPGKPIPGDRISQAADIFAFDSLIGNADRRSENPNCLFDGQSYAIIDHELAFITKGIIGWRSPWKQGALESTARKHLFDQGLKGKKLGYERLEGAWKAIGDQRVSAYRSALPPEWSEDGGAALDALAQITEIRDRIDAAIAEIKRVLA